MEQRILPKNIFLAHFEIVHIFTIFVRSAAVDFLSKIQFSKNCLKVCRNTSFAEWNKEFCQKYFLSTFWDSTNFYHFCKVRGCRFSVKNSILQKLPKGLEKHFFWWVEQRILPEKKFLAHFEIVQNFHHFCKVRGCQFSFKKFNYPKTASKFVETLLLLSGTKNFAKKNFLSTFEIVQKFSPIL